MTCVIQLVVAVFATISFAVIFSVPRKDLILCGISGGLTWLVYFVLTANGMGNVFASLIATFILTIMARVLAVARKNPATVYLLTGIFPLVPGAGVYWTAYHIGTDNLEMALETGFTAFKVAAAIVLGIIFVFEIPQGVFRRLAGRKKRV